MPRVDLTLSPEYKLYILTTLFHVSANAENATAIFDSGSAGSSITERLAEKLKVNLNNLQSRMVSGVTGIRKVRYISKMDVILPNFIVITLPDVSVLENIHKEVTKKTNGIKVGKSVLEASVPNILGLDFLIALKGTAVIKPSENLAYIEW
jgi:hypothetical protein